MTKMKKFLLTATTLASASGGYLVGTHESDPTTQKQYVVFNKKDFRRHKDSTKELISLGIKVDGQLSGINGFVTKEKPMLAMGSDWEIVEDRVYKTNSGCSFKPPSKDPEPTPIPSAQIIPWGVKRMKADEAIKQVDTSTQIVCVVDTGTNWDHPDLKGQIFDGKSFVSGNPSWMDDNGHGTHVAGIVAATANDIDTQGVSQALILTAKVLNSYGSGYGSAIAEGIIYCVDKGASVINMSLGSPASGGPDKLISSAIQYAKENDVITVCAAGNDSEAVGYPAKNCTYAVAASDEVDTLAWFSNFGPEINVIAPGVRIMSTSMNGGLEEMSGTSMAAPHVAGMVALSLAADNPIVFESIGLPKDQEGQGMPDALKTVVK